MNRPANTKGKGWPSPNELCQRLRKPAGDAYLHTLLERIQSEQDLAYDCLRRARWGEGREKSKVRVICPKCEERAWSHSSPRGRTHRWCCRSQNGCGLRFTDTTDTPVDQCPIPLGLVFLALYLPATELDIVMESLDDTVTSADLRDLLKALGQQQHTNLLKGMTRLAARFCGEILLTTKRTPTQKTGSGSRSRPPVNPPGQKKSVSELSRHCTTIQSLLKRVSRQAEALEARLEVIQRRLGPRHTLVTKAKKTS